MKILIVDDDHDLVDVLGFALRRAGFEVLGAYDSPGALESVNRDTPDLSIIDLNLGSWDGLDLVRSIRRKSEMPLIVLTARTSEDDVVRGLDFGADDYLTKPFSHRELIARIRANLRRNGTSWSPPKEPARAELRAGPLVLNTAQHRAICQDEQVDLTVTEFRLLHYLMVNQDVAVPTSAILRQVWGYDDPNGTDVVRVAIHRLRRKLHDEPANPRLIHTVPGVGFMLKTAG